MNQNSFTEVMDKLFQTSRRQTEMLKSCLTVCGSVSICRKELEQNRPEVLTGCIQSRSPFMQMVKYGLYIPLACVVLFSLWDLFTGGPAGWVDQLLTNALVIGLGCQLLGLRWAICLKRMPWPNTSAGKRGARFSWRWALPTSPSVPSLFCAPGFRAVFGWQPL